MRIQSQGIQGERVLAKSTGAVLGRLCFPAHNIDRSRAVHADANCIQDTLSSRAALGLPAAECVARAKLGILHIRFFGALGLNIAL